MNIRTRLLLLILPPTLAIIFTVSVLTYRTWYDEMMAHYSSLLETVVASSAEVIDAEIHEWLFQHKNDPNILENKDYKKYVEILSNIRQKLPISNLYTVKMEIVRKGEPVLRKHPVTDVNKIFDGKDEAYAFRQVYVLDSGSALNEPFHPPGDEDFCETAEQRVYYNKKAFVTAPYVAKATNTRFLSAYAPILDKNGTVVALIAADLSLEMLDKKAHEVQVLILLGALVVLIFICSGIAFISKNISQPVEKLKNAALSLAAGNYGKKIEVQGPQEILELANTLNTLSECLKEHVQRVEENSLFREKLVGEYESFRILQEKLIDGVVERFSHPYVRLKAISMPSKAPYKPLLLEILESKEQDVALSLTEAVSKGFDGVYELLERSPSTSSLSLKLHREGRASWEVTTQLSNMPAPFVWQAESMTISQIHTSEKLYHNDCLILVNAPLYELMMHEDSIQNWFSRVFRHFAEEGLDACCALLSNELSFLSRKQNLPFPLHAICLQIL